MKLIGLLAIVWSCLLVASAPADDHHWRRFKRQHGKHYASLEEDLERKGIYLNNKRSVETQNARLAAQSAHQLSLNHFADWTADELAMLNGPAISAERIAAAMSHMISRDHPLSFLLPQEGDDLPAEVDWRQTPGRVSAVKDQGRCSSSWAFATTGVLEGQEAKLKISSLRGNGTNADLVPLSTQNVLDCSESNMSCVGGLAVNALSDLAKEKGINSEASYPYDAKIQECRYKADKSVLAPTGFAMVQSSEGGLQSAVAKFGPVAVHIDGSNLPLYKSGVYTDSSCPRNLSLGALVVGYGTDPKQGDYWLIKNSWGDKWGEQGYFRMARNKNNQCGIGYLSVVPTF